MGYRDAENSETHCTRIGHAARIDASDNAKGNSDHYRDGQTSGRELERRRITLGNQPPNRLMHGKRLTQIASGETAQIRKILPPERAIQPKLAAHSGNIGRLSVVAQHRDHRVARHQMNQRKGDGCNAERDWNYRENSMRQVFNPKPPLAGRS